MNTTGLDPAELRAWVAETRRRRGLPDRITDPAVIAVVAEMVADVLADTSATRTRRPAGGERGGGRAP